MNVLKFILSFKFLLVITCLINAYNLQQLNLYRENSERIIKIVAKIDKINENSLIEAPMLNNICIGTEAICFPVIVNLNEQNTFIVDKPVTNCGIVPTYDSTSSSSYHKGKILYTYVNTVFGSVNYLNSDDTIQINAQNDPSIPSSEISNFESFLFRIINKINRCSQVVSKGLLGLGYKNELLKRLKDNSAIDQMVYSAELADDLKSLQITIGDYSPALKLANSNDKITYCNIVASSFGNEYWGCTTDIYLRTKDKKKSFLSQTVLFYQILSETKNDVPVIYFAGMKTKYQEFLMEGMLNNNPKCLINSQTDMIVCDADIDLKSLPNLLFVMNGFTYVFKPENLFYKDNSTDNKLIFKAKFPEADYNHIKFSQYFLFSQNISIVYNSERNQIGFYGFNTHMYRGEDDDGNDESQHDSKFWIVIFIILAIVVVIIGIAYAISKFTNKNRNEIRSDFIKY